MSEKRQIIIDNDNFRKRIRNKILDLNISLPGNIDDPTRGHDTAINLLKYYKLKFSFSAVDGKIIIVSDRENFSETDCLYGRGDTVNIAICDYLIRAYELGYFKRTKSIITNIENKLKALNVKFPFSIDDFPLDVTENEVMMALVKYYGFAYQIKQEKDDSLTFTVFGAGNTTGTGESILEAVIKYFENRVCS